MAIENGILKGETCNREVLFPDFSVSIRCGGIIDEHEKDGCCSCHINPPCSYCTTNAEYCPVCGWEAKDDEDARWMEEQKKRAEQEKVEYEMKMAEYRAKNPINVKEIEITLYPK